MGMEKELESYIKNGYFILNNHVSVGVLKYLKEYTLLLKKRMISNPNFETSTKPNGSGFYGRFHDMASSSPLADDIENKKLFDIYTSKMMYDISVKYLQTDEVYLFNDQVVVKLPNEDFSYESHRDNQFGPHPNRTDLKTMNCMIVLDDFTDDNGAFYIKNIHTDSWDTIYPKVGDILLMNGDTYHKSGNNISENSRAVYICVYSTEPFGKNFDRGYYYERFTSR